MLSRAFGPIDLESPLLDFVHSDYYKEEMGPGLKRKFLSFEKLFDLKGVYKVKLRTNLIEKKFSADGKRKVNIDPGYLTAARVVLASTKDFAHRLYLGRGIYGEVTLLYQRKDFQALPWTYPDYRSEACRQFFRELRSVYMAQLAASGGISQEKDMLA